MTISAKIIADSIGPDKLRRRLTTFQLRYPRFIHAEFMTHRLFSRNASSSRAVPVKKMIQEVLDNMAMPIHWGLNQKGMQADVESDALVTLFDGREVSAVEAWQTAAFRAIEVAYAFDKAGYHKQVINRILEPYLHISVIVTATNYDNFFHLRNHKDAQPEICALAALMLEEYKASKPAVLKAGEWHLPYVRAEEKAKYDSELLLKLSSARAARVSYLTHDGREPNVEEDVALFERLVGGEPLHASPVEHQAKMDTYLQRNDGEIVWRSPHLSGNFDPGWIQYRKLFAGEVCNEYAG